MASLSDDEILTFDAEERSRFADLDTDQDDVDTDADDADTDTVDPS
ncbi:MAG: hypothetical protein M3312_02820 [Actinomycetota bacterium]|jgi:hypothetical protein|nr:hypothetical protein [Actinomycetota bacterium]